jgi:hypothetical protein
MTYGSTLIPVAAATTADVGPAIGGRLISVTVTAAAATTTVSLKQNGSGGTVIFTGSVAATTSQQFRFAGAVYQGQLSVTTAGTAGVAYIELG